MTRTNKCGLPTILEVSMCFKALFKTPPTCWWCICCMPMLGDGPAPKSPMTRTNKCGLPAILEVSMCFKAFFKTPPLVDCAFVVCLCLGMASILSHQWRGQINVVCQQSWKFQCASRPFLKHTHLLMVHLFYAYAGPCFPNFPKSLCIFCFNFTNIENKTRFLQK